MSVECRHQCVAEARMWCVPRLAAPDRGDRRSAELNNVSALTLSVGVHRRQMNAAKKAIRVRRFDRIRDMSRIAGHFDRHNARSPKV